MRLLQIDGRGEMTLTDDLDNMTHPYAILSHTWGPDQNEVSFSDLRIGSGKNKDGHKKIMFCGEQAQTHGLEYFWVDTCCIDKSNNTELSEAINSMFRWYRNAERCYVCLSDVSFSGEDARGAQRAWEPAFRRSRWFRRGWTLQELIAPASVEFFSREWVRLGDKGSLEDLVHEITAIPVAVLSGTMPLTDFSVDERFGWAAKRETKKKEDMAYCLLGIFDVSMPLIYGEEDKAFVRLNREIQISAVGPMGNTNNVHWGVDRPVNNMFTGREDILEDLEQKLREAARAGMNDKQPRIVISGMGGLGKSEICLQLAQRLRPLFWGVFWIDVSTPSLAQNGFLGIADRLKISATTWEDGRRGLANVHQRWLLVLDNADDPDLDYQTYFPPSSYGVVILTSRNADCEQYATADFIALTQLARGDAQHLVFKAARVPDGERSAVENDARAVAALLNSHPLALIQAGAYVAHGHCTLARYPEVFTRFRKRLLAFRPLQVQSRYGDVYACFQASIQILQSSATASAQDALQLLPLLSMYGTREIPLQLFEAAWNGGRKFLALGDSLDSHDLALTSWHVSRLPAFIDPDNNSWDPFRLIEAVHTLRSLALVSATAQGEQMRVSMHPLLHAWARDCQDEQQQHTSWVSASCIIAISSSDREFWRSQARLLQPHLQVLLDCDMRCIYGSDRSVSITEILIECGWTLERLRDDNSLLRLTDRLCAHHQLSRVVVKEEWLSLYQLRGSALLHHGKFKDSIAVLEQIAKIRERLVDDHPDRAKSQHDLASAYILNGQVNQAITLLEHLNRIQEKLAEDHPNRLASQHELAAAYLMKGQIVEAIKILEDVVRIESKDLPKNHPNRLASQHELACAYVAIGQISEAIPRLEYIAQIKEELTEDHPSRLVTQHELAYAYLKNARVEEAIVLIEHVVRMQESLAEDHPSRLASQGLLARAYQESGQVEKAARLLTAGTRPRERLEKDKKSTHVGFTQRNPDSSPAVDPSMCSPSHNASESLVSQVVNLQSTSDLTHHQVLRRTNR